MAKPILNPEIKQTNFTDPVLTTSTKIKQVHVDELKEAIEKLNFYSVNVDNCNNCSPSNCCQSCQSSSCQTCQRRNCSNTCNCDCCCGSA